ncbi:MAG: V-type ATPase subunit [Clostridia bacterium]|nr:V-type ATPase subunit [Clostridia bacterium]
MYLINIMKYGNSKAKLNGMYAKRLKKSDLQELIHQNNLKSAILILKTKNIELNELDETATRIQIETALDKILITDIVKIKRLLGKKDKDILIQFIEKYKIRCIKSIFRKLYSKTIVHYNPESIKIWTESIFKEIDGIQNAETIAEFMNYISKTQYKKVFENFSNKENQIEELNIFQIENEIDKIYLNKLISISENKNTRLENMISKKTELMNLLWLYRIKKYYNYSEDKIKDIFIKQVKCNNKLEIEKFLSLENDTEILENFQKKAYIKKYEENLSFEQNINIYLYKEYYKIFKSQMFDISNICAYINLIEMENTDIVRIIEAIRYGLSKEEIQKKLVTK